MRNLSSASLINNLCSFLIDLCYWECMQTRWTYFHLAYTKWRWRSRWRCKHWSTQWRIGWVYVLRRGNCVLLLRRWNGIAYCVVLNTMINYANDLMMNDFDLWLPFFIGRVFWGMGSCISRHEKNGEANRVTGMYTNLSSSFLFLRGNNNISHMYMLLLIQDSGFKSGPTRYWGPFEWVIGMQQTKQFQDI